jgi:hypothetical protein
MPKLTSLTATQYKHMQAYGIDHVLAATVQTLQQYQQDHLTNGGTSPSYLAKIATAIKLAQQAHDLLG